MRIRVLPSELQAALKIVEELKESLRTNPPKAAFMGAFPYRVEKLLDAERRVESLTCEESPKMICKVSVQLVIERVFAVEVEVEEDSPSLEERAMYLARETARDLIPAGWDCYDVRCEMEEPIQKKKRKRK